ncbi:MULTISPECIES: FecR domain-containing protein [Brachymonas]|uniref:FecR domain-containing protein n=1 Tax=Brachymonas TaxID=28219 RepID=UPI002E77A746|nr:FecR domain-containing protein [Brachymonas sp. J145]MEE1654084.1 FecR domain-containing protein [Brachymonas sp. J145]
MIHVSRSSASASRSRRLRPASLPRLSGVAGSIGFCLALLAAGPALAQASMPVPSHVVQRGDTIQSISKRLGIAASQWEQVALYNKLPDGGKLPPVGTTVRLPLQLLNFTPARAHVITTVGHVQVGGQSIQAGVRLGENARIQTLANSSAMLELSDGSRVQLMPHSVADIVENRHYPVRNDSGQTVNWFASKLRLAQGALEAAVQKVSPRAKPLEVETATSMIGVRGTRFRVASADPYVRADRAEVLEGIINNENTWKDTEILVHAGEGVVVDPNQGIMQAIPLLPAPDLAAQQAPLFMPDATWTFPEQPEARAYRVIVSRDAQHVTTQRSELLAGPAMDMNVLGEGLWYLRVRAVDAHGLEGRDAFTRLQVIAAPSLLDQASVYQEGPDFQPVLRWSRVLFKQPQEQQIREVPSQVSAQLFHDAALRSPVGELIQGQTHEAVLPRIGAGTYYLRVTASHPQLPETEQQTYVLRWAGDTRIQGYHTLLDYLPRG